jgi:alcohol dehydrogenase, propanol-preferring
MHAMVLEAPGRPLAARSVPIRDPDPGEVLVRVAACAVCRTDLHVVDGELPDPKLPLIPGHEIVGRIERLGQASQRFQVGDRIGIPWLGWTCGQCQYCRSHRENLCEQARFTGYTLDGGYAEFTLAHADYCYRLPDAFDDVSAAPLLCAGLIGYRSLRKVGDARRLGIYGFGAAAHIVAQIARFQEREVFAFTRPGDESAQAFARRLGAAWAGDSDKPAPAMLDAAIIFAPAGALVPAALRAVDKGGVVVCGGIHMSDIPSFPYRELWHEETVCSVANLTRSDAAEFFEIINHVPLRIETQTFPLDQANVALARLRSGQLTGAAVLVT